MTTYETVFITAPNLTEDVERSTVESMTAIVAERGGSLIANDRMGRRRLAYPIKKFDDGVYIRLLYDAEPDVPHELERRLRLSDHVLRSLTVRLESDWAKDAKEKAAQAKIRAEQEAKEAAEAATRAAEEGAEAGTTESAPDAAKSEEE